VNIIQIHQMFHVKSVSLQIINFLFGLPSDFAKDREI